MKTKKGSTARQEVGRGGDRSRSEFTVSVPLAGLRYYGLSRNASYAAAQKGDIPTIRIGGRLRVPVAIVERKLVEG